MRLQVTMNRIFTLAALAAMFAGASLAAAQEATAPATEAAAPQFQGVSTLMLLLGLAAVAAVGLVWFLRERSLPGSDETP